LPKFGLGRRAGRNATCRRDGLTSEFDHGREGPSLVGNISFDAFDQIGDQIAAAAKLNINLRPGIVRPVPQGDEPIVDPADVKKHRTSDEDQGYHPANHVWSGDQWAIVNDRISGQSGRAQARD
jgi:hypothetical protein